MFLTLPIGSMWVIIFTKENDISPTGIWQDAHRRLHLYSSLYSRLLDCYIPQKRWSFRDLWFMVWNVLCQSSFCAQWQHSLRCLHDLLHLLHSTICISLRDCVSWIASSEQGVLVHLIKGDTKERYRTQFIKCLIHRDSRNMFLTSLVSVTEMTLEILLGPSLIPVIYHEFGHVIWLLTNKTTYLNQQGTRTSSLLVFVSFLFLTLSGSHLHYST